MGVLAVSPKLVLVITRAEKDTWEVSLTEAWKDEPASCCERLRHRPLKELGTLAQIQATGAQIAAAKERKAHSADATDPGRPKTMQATVSIPLGITGPLEGWIPKILDGIAANGKTTLTRAAGDEGLRAHEWKPIFRADGSWQGKMVIPCTSRQELQQLHRAAHGARVASGGHEASIEVESLFTDFDGGGRAAPGGGSH